MRNPNALRVRMAVSDHHLMERLAELSVERARESMPKLTGEFAESLEGVSGPDWFGVKWGVSYGWYQEAGINPFTMDSLAGKVIPMWVADPIGEERAKNPDIKVRTRKDGGVEVLIFRRAAKKGERKTVYRGILPVSVPKSYPGAPGRISRREHDTTVYSTIPSQRGKVTGQISKFNVGVRWHHPGLRSGGYVLNGIRRAAAEAGVKVVTAEPVNL